MPIVDHHGEEANLELVLKVLDKQGEVLHGEIVNQALESRRQFDEKFHVLDSGIQDLQSHNKKQNGTIARLVSDVETLKDHNIQIKQRSRDLKNFQMNCDAVKVSKWLKKYWWSLVLGTAFVFAFMEWLYHDSMLLQRINELFQNLKIFKP